ncbi:MAG: hypothetical protein JXA82_01670, partial [Sedimentisphaerales bacterium]|nr:hypothetical protein [Sedimentisphaerales bacterium]
MTYSTLLRILLVPCCSLLFPTTVICANDSVKNQIEAHFPFSFRYGGQSFEGIRSAWIITREQNTLPDNRLQRIVTYNDPHTPLSVTAEGIDYPRSSAKEWLVRFENRGSEATEIIDEIRSLHIRLPGSVQDSFLLHFALGDHNSAESFAPQSKTLSAGEKAVFSPRAGRSSDPYLPFFNLQGKEGGLIIAIG